MNRSKWVVIVIVFLIALGVSAWSWVNIFHNPGYDPEQAHLFLEYYAQQCEADHPEEACDYAIGHHHRSCFRDHLEEVPADDIEEEGPYRYNLRRYIDCMDEASLDFLQRHQE